MRNKEKKIRILKIAIFSIIIILMIWIATIVVGYITDFKPTDQTALSSLDQVLAYQEIQLLQMKESMDGDSSDFDIYLYVKFPHPTFEGNEINDTYYNESIDLIADVIGYKNIEILDDDKGLKIDIYGNQTTQEIEKVMINGEENYFDHLSSKVAVSSISEEKIMDIEIQNDIVKNAILNKWSTKGMNYGSKDTTINQYDVYFDEGIEVRNIADKIYNIVFTDKYTSQIIGNITTKSSFDEIINKLGEPSIGSKEEGTLGYKTKDCYLFFQQKQISIYPYDTSNKDKFAALVSTFENTLDQTKLVDDTKALWNDYDTYHYQGVSNLELTYALKGVKIQFNAGNQNGIVLYRNYLGKITNDTDISEVKNGTKTLPNNIYFENKNLIYEVEKTRYYGSYQFDSAYNSYILSYHDTRTKFPKLMEDTTKNDYKNKSNQFFVIRYGNLAYVSSIKNEYPPFQIDSVLSTLWIDDTHLVYSIDGNGIFTYNAMTRENKKILSEVEGISLVINKYENGILTYDNGKEVECSIK